MKVKGYLPTEIEIGELEQKRVCLEYLYRKFNWSANHFIENGIVYKSENFATSHSWNQNIVVREASNLDFFIDEAVKKIKISK